MIISNHASYFHSHPTFPELLGTPFPGADSSGANGAASGDESESGGGKGSGKGSPAATATATIEYPFNVKYGDGAEIP